MDSSDTAAPKPQATAEGGNGAPPLKHRTIDVKQLGFRQLYSPDDDDDIEIDVIAVHGIAADPDLTWTWSDKNQEKTVNWLCDEAMLPGALPRARVLRFGYDSIWYGPNAVKQRLHAIATGMLEQLCGEREGYPNRPMIFIGHCFGGLVMQKAYNVAKANTDDYPGIAASTAGMIFLGTPHRGTGRALHSQGQIYQAIVSRAQCETQEGILKTLEEGNETLVDVVREFTRLVNVGSRKMDIFCFFEQQSTIVGKIVRDDSIREFVVDEQSGVLHGHRSQGLPLDHFNLNKFSSEEDGNYKSVKLQLTKMAKAVAKATKEERPANTSDQIPVRPDTRLSKQDMFGKLQPVDYENKLRDVANERPKGELYPQGKWLVEDPDFINWRATPNSFLWLNGKVGAGKTLLSETVIRHLRQYTSTGTSPAAIAYFFIEHRDPTTFECDVLVKSLLAQFYELMPLGSAASALENMIDQLDKSDNAERALQNFISACSGGVYVVIDGLDECPRSKAAVGLASARGRRRQRGPRHDIHELLATFRKWNLDNFHLFLSSRPDPDIAATVQAQKSTSPLEVRILNMEDRRNAVDDVIGRLIDATLQEPVLEGSCLEGRSELTGRLRRDLIRKANGVIFYASIQLQIITEEPPFREEDLTQLLDELPEDLFDAYERALLRLPKTHLKVARRLVNWQVLTTTPMTVTEVAEAMRIPLESMHEDSNLQHDDQLKLESEFPHPRAIVGLLPGLLLIRPTPTTSLGLHHKSYSYSHGDKCPHIVSVGHYSFLEYLTSDAIKTSDHQTVKEFFIDKGKMRISMAVLCLRYFLHAVSSSKDRMDEEVDEIQKGFPLVCYAIDNGFKLIEGIAPEEWPDDLRSLIQAIFRPGSLHEVFRRLLGELFTLGYYGIKFSGPLLYFIDMGLTNTLRYLLEDSSNLASPKEIDALLQEACVRNHATAVERLLQLGADPFAPGGGYQCAVEMTLVSAAWKALDALVDYQKDILSRCDSLGHNHLRKAATGLFYRTSRTIVEDLLRRGADPNHRDNPGEPPMLYEPIVRYLHPYLAQFLSSLSIIKVDIDARDSSFGNALQCAVVVANDEAVFKLLLAGAAMHDPADPEWEALLAGVANGANVNLNWYNIPFFPNGDVAALRLLEFQEQFGIISRVKGPMDLEFAREAMMFVREQRKKETLDDWKF